MFIIMMFYLCLPLIFIPTTKSLQVPINKISTKNNFDTSNIFQLIPNNKYQTEWKRKMLELMRRNYLIKTARKMKINKNKEEKTGKSTESLKKAIKEILMSIYH